MVRNGEEVNPKASKNELGVDTNIETCVNVQGYVFYRILSVPLFLYFRYEDESHLKETNQITRIYKHYSVVQKR